MTKRYTLLVPQTLYREIVAQAEAEFPNECCGLLAGVLGGNAVRAVRRFPLVNAAERPKVEYYSEARSLLAAHKSMQAAGLDIVAAYHSHPSSEPVPSKTDCARSWSGEAFINLIISIGEGQPILRAWWITEEGFAEGKWEFAEDEGDVLDE